MINIVITKRAQCKVGGVETGMVFRLDNTGVFFLKLHDENAPDYHCLAVELETGYVKDLNSTAKCEVYEATLTLKQIEV